MDKSVELVIRALKGRGTVFNLIGDYNRAQADYYEMIKIQPTPKTKIWAYNGIGQLCLSSGKFKESLYWAKMAKRFSVKNSYVLGLVRSLLVSSQALWQQGFLIGSLKEIAQALGVLKTGLMIEGDSREIIELQKAKTTIMLNRAIIHCLQGKYPKSLPLLNKALRICKKNNDLQRLTSILINIGNVYCEMGKFRNSLYYYNWAQKITEKSGDKHGLSTALFNAAKALAKFGKYESALAATKKSFTISESINNISGIAFSLLAMGNIYRRRGDYDAAFVAYKKSLMICKKTKDTAFLIANLINLADIYLERGDYSKCKKVIRQAETSVNEFKNPYSLTIIIIAKAKLCLQTNLPQEACHYLEEALVISKQYNLIPEFINASSLFVKLIIKYGNVSSYTITSARKFLSNAFIAMKKEKALDVLISILPLSIEYNIMLKNYKKAEKQAQQYFKLVKKNNRRDLNSLAYLYLARVCLHTGRNPNILLKNAEKWAKEMKLRPLLREIRKLWKELREHRREKKT